MHDCLPVGIVGDFNLVSISAITSRKSPRTLENLSEMFTDHLDVNYLDYLILGAPRQNMPPLEAVVKALPVNIVSSRYVKSFRSKL